MGWLTDWGEIQLANEIINNNNKNENKMETAEFNLELALAGHPLVTRDGRKVDYIKTNKAGNEESKLVYKLYDGYVFSTYTNGLWGRKAGDECDLFLDLSTPWDKPLEEGDKVLVREKKSDILIATDAIAMGLNLPIKNILFTTDTKFDGISRRKINVNEIVQIAGRAGRYKIFEKGFLGATRRDVLEHIQEEFFKPVKTIKPPFAVKINNEQLEALASHIKTNSLTKVLKFFKDNMTFDGPFVAANISSMLDASKIVDKRDDMTLEDKYLLAQAPITLKSNIILQAYEAYIAAVIKKRVCE